MKVEEFITWYNAHFKRTSSLFAGLILMIFDAIAIMLCIGISFFIINLINPQFINFRSFVTYSVYLPLIIIVFYAAALYPGIMISPDDEIRRLSICTFFSFMGIIVSIFIDDNIQKYPVTLALLLAIPIAVFVLPIVRHGTRYLFSHFKNWGIPAVIYCTGNSGQELIKRMQLHPELGYRPALIINSSVKKEKTFSDIPIFPSSDALLSAVKKLKIKLAIICDYAEDIFDIVHSYRYTVSVSSEQNLLISGSPQLRDIAGIVGFSSTHHLTQKRSRIVKRLIDLLLVFISLPLVLTICIIIAITVKSTSDGNVLYGHKRVGKDGKIFTCWKFRTMYKDADKQLAKLLKNKKIRAEWEKEQKLKHDPRVTNIGKFLRKTSLDELPQLLNILLGQMSFIGPRPITEDELEKYGNKSTYILSVRPGLSGMWQTSGRSNTGYEDRVALDIFYIHNWSVWLDVWLIIKTLYVVVQGKGAY